MTKVIGSQTDVPDIGDPILSPWYQDTAKKIVHVFATTTARDLWTTPPDGAICQAPAGIWWERVGGVWQRGPGGAVVVHERNATNGESGDVGGTPAPISSLGTSLTVNRLYQITATSGIIHRAASGAAFAYLRIIVNGSPLESREGYMNGPNVAVGASLTTYWRSTINGPATFTYDIAQAWYSTNPVRFIRSPDFPSALTVIDLGM